MADSEKIDKVKFHANTEKVRKEVKKLTGLATEFMPIRDLERVVNYIPFTALEDRKLADFLLTWYRTCIRWLDERK